LHFKIIDEKYQLFTSVIWFTDS